MKRPLSPQPRVRGWRRRERALDAWAAQQREKELHPELERQSATIRFDSWGGAPFPLRIRRRMVEHLVGIHDRWLERVSGWEVRPYLGIWLHLPSIYDSGVVLATGSLREHYEQQVHTPGVRETYTTEPAGPPPLYQGRPCDLARFEWVHEVTRTVEHLRSFDEREWPGLLRESVHTVGADGGDTQVTLVSHHWLGRLRG